MGRSECGRDASTDPLRICNGRDSGGVVLRVGSELIASKHEAKKDGIELRLCNAVAPDWQHQHQNPQRAATER